VTTPENTTTTPPKKTTRGKKEFPPSRAGAGVQNRLLNRYRDTTPISEDEAGTDQPAQVSQTPAEPVAPQPAAPMVVSQTPAKAVPDNTVSTSTKSKPGKTPTERAREAGMVTRSWYLPETVADELAAAAGELAAGVPGVAKHVALSALIQAGLRHRDDVRADLIADLQRQLAHASQTPART
jgi:hypothetical protein